MNILITSIGSFSASTVVQAIQKGYNSRIYGCDIHSKEWHHVSSSFENVLRAPLVKNEKQYKQFIDDVVEKYNIKLIIPLTDVEVDYFHQYRAYYEMNDITVTIPNSRFISIARNKYLLFEYSKGIKTLKSIPTYKYNGLSNQTKFPLIAKIVNGRSSEGMYIVNSLQEVRNFKNIDNYIFQEVIKGKICTADYVRSASTNKDFCLPRWELIRTKNGAGMVVETFHSKKITEIVSQIGKDLDINGCVNFEFIVDNDFFYLIDINPRFSAGIGFSQLAGYNFIISHLNCFMGNGILPSISYKNMILEKRMSEVINCILS